MSAVIGALRVDLGLNSAEFQSGLKKAASGLGNFAKTAGIGLAAVATAAVAAGTALGYAVKGAIDHADQMGEMAQKVGVSVEALTSLGYAAKLSGTDTETLATGLRKLSQNMLTVAQGSTGPVATAFTALGVSVQDANGSLRGSDQVMMDVAAKFALMEDGAHKTALAVQLFGKSGAELIPFLSQGRDGIGALTAEADRLGITISGSTANAAGAFNDTIDRLQATFQGVINKIAAGVLPSLNEFGAKLADPQFAASAQQIGVAIVDAMGMAVGAINNTVGAFNNLRGAMEWANSHDMFGRPKDMGNGAGKEFFAFNSPEQAKKLLADALNAGKTTGPGPDFYTGMFGTTGPELAATSQQVAAAFEPVITNTQAAADAASALNKTMADGKAVFEATRTPAETYGLEVERLNALLQKGAIDQDTYNRAVSQAQTAFQQAEQSGNKLAQSLSTGLANMFSSVVDGSKSAVDAVGDLSKSLGSMFIQQGFQALFGGMFGSSGGLGSMLGGLFGGGGGGLKLGFNGIPGFDGGGYTGAGARSGGLDGRGGFMAMLHPDETVLDHTKGQSGGSTTISISITGSKPDAAAIAREVKRVLPDAMNTRDRNNLRRTGP